MCYCETGRRSSAAAFLLSEQGFESYVLKGGLQSMSRPG
ncbi:MAG TPA: rhodanese-like domain-containing protein [Gammaproteobacteria bacterium]